MAARGMPSWQALLWITLAVLGARTAAMAANDTSTAISTRAIREPPGERSRRIARAVHHAVVYRGRTRALARFRVDAQSALRELMPLAALGVLFYPLCKRFTTRALRARRWTDRALARTSALPDDKPGRVMVSPP